MYGYFEFFHFEWLDKILSWQDTAHGCYKWAGWPQERLTLGQCIAKSFFNPLFWLCWPLILTRTVHPVSYTHLTLPTNHRV